MNVKFKNLNIECYESIALEKYLEDMASKGWILSYLNDNCLRFEKGKKSTLRYSVKRVDKDTFLGVTDNDKLESVKETLFNEGWLLITSSNQTYIFATNNPFALDPYKDNIKENLIYNIKKSEKTLVIKILIYLTAFIAFSLYIGKLNMFKHSNKIESILIINLLLIYIIVYNIFDFINLLRYKLSIKNNISIDVLSNSKRFKFKINLTTWLIALFYSLTLILTLLCKIQNLFMIGFPILLIVFRIIKFELNYRNKITSKNFSIYIKLMFLFIVLFVCFVFYNTLALSGVSSNIKAPLTLEDFNDYSLDKSYYIHHDSLISTSFNAYEKGKLYSLNYDFIDVKFNLLADKYYKDTVEFYLNNSLQYKTTIKYYEKLNVPKDMRVHILSPSNKIIIKVRNKILIIEPVENMYKEDLINLIYKKLH